MADTSYLRNVVEPYVRDQLRMTHGITFEPKTLKLTTGGKHGFDAVSTDGRIVCGIKAIALSYDGALKAGHFRNAISELYYLSLVDAPIRTLVLTSRVFYEAFGRRIAGCIAPGIEIECIPLPPDMQADVERVIAAASKEVRPETIRAAVEDDLT